MKALPFWESVYRLQ